MDRMEYLKKLYPATPYRLAVTNAINYAQGFHDAMVMDFDGMAIRMAEQLKDNRTPYADGFTDYMDDDCDSDELYDDFFYIVGNAIHAMCNDKSSASVEEIRMLLDTIDDIFKITSNQDAKLFILAVGDAPMP